MNGDSAASADAADQSQTVRTARAMAADAVLVAAGAVLVVAAGLKLYAMLTRLSPASYWKILEALVEMAAGFWCGCGAWRRGARVTAVFLFLVFAGVSLARGWAGHQSCGCFGELRVNPWATLLLDALVLAELLLWPPPRPVPRASKRRLAITGLLLLLVLAAGGWVLARHRPAWLHADGKLTGGGGTVFMQPVGWTHHRLPLLKYLRYGRLYAHGRWLVVLYHHGCQVCWRAIAQVAAKLASAKHPHQVLLVQVPPDGNLPSAINVRGMFQAHLDFHRRWSIPMFPLFVDVHNGIVTRVRIYSKGYWSGF